MASLPGTVRSRWFASFCVPFSKHTEEDVQSLSTCADTPNALILIFFFPRCSVAALYDGKDIKELPCGAPAVVPYRDER